MRGEKRLPLYWSAGEKGSPPRARGKVTWAPTWESTTGITPACAGKSLSLSRLSRLSRDHPRVRGEKNSFYYLQD